MRAALDLVFAGAGGRTVLTRRRYRWPLLIGRVFAEPGLPAAGTVTIQNAAGTLIPGDAVHQRVLVASGGQAIVRGQGATVVSGVPGGAVAVEDTELRVEAGSRLVFDVPPRILTPHARYRQRTRVCVEPSGSAVLVDAVVLHPELTDDVFGSYESCIAISALGGRVLARDAQHLETMPRARRAPAAFAAVFLVGSGFDRAMTAQTPVLESLSVLSGQHGVYVGASDLPNGAGWVVRIAASDGGTLRKAIGTVIAVIDAVPAATTNPSCPCG